MKSLLSALSITVCTVTAAALSGGTAIGSAQAQSFQPAIVFDMGGKFDKSFNEAAYVGAETLQEGNRDRVPRVRSHPGSPARAGAPHHGPARRQCRSSASASPRPAPWRRSPQEFPDTKFCIIDSVVERPNVQSITFKEHEGSFLVGMMAALASKTGKVGFVGGMDIPLIRNFAIGYQQGVKHANPQAEIFQNMTGTTPAAWSDPTRGGELAKSQIDRGADVIYAAAGGTGIGVLQAVADAKKLSIGVDSNQNHLHPGSVLTSMIKRVDVAVYNCMKSAKDGTWAPAPASSASRRTASAIRSTTTTRRWSPTT